MFTILGLLFYSMPMTANFLLALIFFLASGFLLAGFGSVFKALLRLIGLFRLFLRHASLLSGYLFRAFIRYRRTVSLS